MNTISDTKNEANQPEDWYQKELQDEKKAIGARLRSERERLGFTQAEIAQKISIHRNTQARYERGERDFDGNYLDSIRRLGVDLSLVLHGIPLSDQLRPSVILELTRHLFSVLGFTDEQRDSFYQSAIDFAVRYSNHALDSGKDLDSYGTGDNDLDWIEEMRKLASSIVSSRPVCGPNSGVDVPTLASVLEMFDREAASTGAAISTTKRAHAVAMIYVASVTGGKKVDPELVKSAIKLAV